MTEPWGNDGEGTDSDVSAVLRRRIPQISTCCGERALAAELCYQNNASSVTPKNVTLSVIGVTW